VSISLNEGGSPAVGGGRMRVLWLCYNNVSETPGGSNKQEEAVRIKELDVVELTKELPQIPQGTKGTVVFVYSGGSEVEVEFVDQEGNTLGVERVSAELLRKVGGMKKNKKPSRKEKIHELIESLAQDPQVRVKNPDEVKKYLMKFIDILDIVPKAVNIAKKHFPEAQLVLSVYKDPESYDRYLDLCVRLEKYDEFVMGKIREARGEYREDIITRLRKAESEFWDDLFDKKGEIFLTTDFQKPEE
jgi:hypothetical protein